MAEQKESSVLFNLRELMNLEEDRIQTEEDKKKKADDDARVAKAAAEKAAADAEAARLKADADAVAAAERATRQEEERKVREKEERELKIRLDAEQKARQAEQDRLLAHEQEVKRIEATRRKGVHPAVFAAIAVVLIGGVAGIWFGVVVPQRQAAERERVARQQADEQHAQEVARIAADAEAQRQQVAAAQAALAAAESRAHDLELSGDTAAAEQVRADARRTGGGGTRRAAPRGDGPAAAPAARPRHDDSDDPLAGLDGL